MKYEYFPESFPYCYISEIVPRDIYDKINFPEISPVKNRRATKGLFSDDEGYSDIISSDGWKDVYQYFNNPKTIKEIVNLFSKHISKYDCNIQADKIYFSNYLESNEEFLLAKMDNESDPNALFTKFDFQAGDITYEPKIHTDHLRRLIGGVLFFSDYREEKMEGGKFAIYRDEEFNDDRICHKPKLIKEFPVIHNTGVLFLNSNDGFHGNTKITSIEGWRKWVYYSISSKRNIWATKKKR